MYEPTCTLLTFTFGQLYEFWQIMTKNDFLEAKWMILSIVRTDFNLVNVWIDSHLTYLDLIQVTKLKSM